MRRTCSSLRALLSVASFALVACGSSEANVSGRIGWDFDYRDWTDDAAKAEVRGCHNAPASPNPSAPPDAAITHVRVVIEDPAGQVPGVDQAYPCEQGAAGRLVELRGLVPQMYQLTLEGRDADGIVHYRLFEPELDLTTVLDKTFRLPAAVGEFSFIPTFSGAISCPPGVESIVWSMFEKEDGVPKTEPAIVGMQPACESGLAAEVWVRRVPTSPTVSTTGAYLPTPYELRVAAVDSASNELFCARQSKNIDPGAAAPNSLPGSPDLTPSACD